MFAVSNSFVCYPLDWWRIAGYSGIPLSNRLFLRSLFYRRNFTRCYSLRIGRALDGALARYRIHFSKLICQTNSSSFFSFIIRESTVRFKFRGKSAALCAAEWRTVKIGNVIRRIPHTPRRRMKWWRKWWCNAIDCATSFVVPNFFIEKRDSFTTCETLLIFSYGLGENNLW